MEIATDAAHVDGFEAVGIRQRSQTQLTQRRNAVRTDQLRRDEPVQLVHELLPQHGRGQPTTTFDQHLGQSLLRELLHRLLVEEEQIALAVGGLQMEGFDPGLVYFYLTLPPGADVDAVEARALEELARVAVEGVTQAELRKAQNILLADYWRERATINGKAAALGHFDMFTGSYENLFSLPEDVSEITAEQLRAVAAKVFQQKKMTVGVLRSRNDISGASE